MQDYKLMDNDYICPLCDKKSEKKYSGMKGYMEGLKYDVIVCENCEVSYVDPLESKDEIYEHIYRQVDKVPGYERYFRYASVMKSLSEPFQLLADSESAYWAVKKTLEKYFPDKKASILEVGSGLGYLTYALNKEGYKAIGLDISEDAVAKARVLYGDYYKAYDLFELAEEQNEKYDCIIMMEVIEHVNNPIAFIEAGLSLLKPNGKLVITTPNKSATPANTIWHSDFPPIHLWFFAEKTIKLIANKLNRKCEFVDFTEYSKKFYSPMYAGDIEKIQIGLPRLLANGDVRPEVIVTHEKTKWFGLRGRFFLSYIRRRLKKKEISNRSTTQCIVLS